MDSILDRFADNLTEVTYITNPAVARDDEIKKLILVLLTPEKSAVLVGKPGIGKTAIVEGLAYRIQRNEVPDALQGYTIYRVNTTALINGNGEENRVLKLVEELKNREKVILFIDEIHTLIGNGALDLANMFKEGLSRGSIKIIGATTTYEYERYIMRDKAFLRRFEKVDVSEPTEEMTVEILLKTLPKLEKQTGVILPYTDFINEKIMKFIVNMTSEYKRVYEISSRYPDICLVILRQAFSNCIYDNQTNVTFKHIYDAIRFSKAVYPDVIKKELVVFKDTFKFNFNQNSGNVTVTQSNQEPIAVPDFINKSAVDVLVNPVFTQNFKLVSEDVYDDKVPEGYIVGQSVKSDTLVQPGTEIVIYVSKGKQQVVLPSVVGYDYAEAEKRLTELGFKCIKKEIYEGSYRNNEVVQMAPFADKAYDVGTEVYLNVFVEKTEPETDEFGQTVAAATPQN